MSGRTGIFVALSVAVLYFVGSWIVALRRGLRRDEVASSGNQVPKPNLFQVAVGFVTNFFDTLGIGSFATTTAIFKIGRMARDEVIPGTMNVGHTLPTILPAFLYIAIIQVNLPPLMLLTGPPVLLPCCVARFFAMLPLLPST